MKRFQECNWLVKLWRYRFYILIPFKFIYWRYIFNTAKTDLTKKQFWGILIGEAQIDMHWHYTSEEVFDSIREKIDKHGK